MLQSAYKHTFFHRSWNVRSTREGDDHIAGGYSPFHYKCRKDSYTISCSFPRI